MSSTIQWRNGPNGYGLVTKSLHWLMAAALVAQFGIGYLMEADDSGRGRGRGRGRGGESGHGRGRGGDDHSFWEDGGTLLKIHVALGVTILTLAIIRWIWRKTTPLPPWAPTLSNRERTLAHWTERALYLCMILMPASGLALVFGDDDLLPLHVASHVAFFVAITLHVGLMLKHQLVDRDHLVARMTRSRPQQF